MRRPLPTPWPSSSCWRSTPCRDLLHAHSQAGRWTRRWCCRLEVPTAPDDRLDHREGGKLAVVRLWMQRRVLYGMQVYLQVG
jgi:hypothetical protein